jgi:hypothetical protein
LIQHKKKSKYNHTLKSWKKPVCSRCFVLSESKEVQHYGKYKKGEDKYRWNCARKYIEQRARKKYALRGKGCDSGCD